VDTILTLFAWPIALVVLGVVALLIFRRDIAALIGRTKKVSKEGLETYEHQPAPPSAEKKGAEEFFKSYDNPLLLEAEQIIEKDLRQRAIEGADREKTLIRALATANITQHFERLYNMIWASQLSCLRYLNPRGLGAERGELIPIYEASKTLYPDLYKDYSFDQWLGFLQRMNVVTERERRLFITVAGREFLKYLIATGKDGPFHG